MDLYLVLDGRVVETRGAEVVAEYGVHDAFDAMALFGAARDTTFTAREDTLCCRVPGPAFHDAVRTNAAFGAWYSRQFGERLRALAARRTSRDLAPLVTARVRDARLRPVPRAGSQTTLREAVSLMKQAGARSVMVRDGVRVGILDGIDLLDACLARGEAGNRPIGPLTRFDAPTLRADGFLFDALALMAGALMAGGGAAGILVTDGDAAVGVLEPSDLLDFMASRSRLLMVCID
ncbi:MAG TPA: cyclic nucleotide-binding domain-containing protein, partial [Arenibaculum sp.]|nr:cyclic nucleotide-binding domain-containing protein [Arenibaculum sp.]